MNTKKKTLKEKIDEIIASRPKSSQGKIYKIKILHDEWCDLITKDGVCNCDPDVIDEGEIQ